MRGNITSAASITAKEAAPYKAMTRNTCLRLSSAKNRWYPGVSDMGGKIGGLGSIRQAITLTSRRYCVRLIHQL
jgi:hypothetical protein